MRDKLIELIRIASHELTSRCVGDCGDCADKIANHILADGWIRPPCKVGDILYVISNDKQILPFVVNRIIITDYIKIKVDYIAGRDYEIKYLLLQHFGKTVFLTKEEAEKALKGVEQK